MRILHSKTTKIYLLIYMFIFLLMYRLYRSSQIKHSDTQDDDILDKSEFVQEVRYEEEEEVKEDYDTKDNSPREKPPVGRAKILEEYRNITKYPPFQPITEEEFPTLENGVPRIPHTIHQIWSNITVPDIFVTSMQSFVNHNPTWNYMFWTYDSGRKLIAERHPQLLKIYDNVGNQVQKSDMLRLVALYEFGGIYADLDVKNVRPLDITTRRYSCILIAETFEHSTLLNDMPVYFSNAVFSCRQKHPFLKHLLHHLEFENPKGWAVFSTGPGFLTRMFMKYNKLEMSDLYRPKQNDSTNSPFFYKGTRDAEDKDGIYVPNTQYFMDTIDPNIIDQYGDLEDCVKGTEISFLIKRGCAEFEHRRAIRKRRKFTFTVHYWIHMWMIAIDEKKDYRFVHVKEIIPNCTLY